MSNNKIVCVENIYELAEEIKPRSMSYVSNIRCKSGLGELLWVEVYKIEKKAKLTTSQKSVLELWLMGNNQNDIAGLLSVSKSTVSEHLKLALRKTEKLKYTGLITHLIEEFGIRAIREHLADLCE